MRLRLKPSYCIYLFCFSIYECVYLSICIHNFGQEYVYICISGNLLTEEVRIIDFTMHCIFLHLSYLRSVHDSIFSVHDSVFICSIHVLLLFVHYQSVVICLTIIYCFSHALLGRTLLYMYIYLPGLLF